MVTAILENSWGEEIDRVNCQRLASALLDLPSHRFRLLGQLDSYSYDVFSRSDMVQLRDELTQLKSICGTEEEIAALVSLATRCEEIPEATLTFTPFGP